MSNLPVIVAPMFLVSTPDMVIEASKSGTIGSFPLLNARPIENCEKWLERIKNELDDEPLFIINSPPQKMRRAIY